MAAGIPDDAFNPVTGDDKKVASAYKKRNRNEKAVGQKRLDFEKPVPEHAHEFAELFGIRLDFPEETPADVRRKSELFENARRSEDWWHDWTAANLWTSAFFTPLTKLDDPVVPTHETFMDYFLRDTDRPQMTGGANALANHLHSFHWHLEFPDVFERGGCALGLGNAPGERIKLQEEGQWAEDPYISTASNKAERFRRIEEYRQSADPAKRARIEQFDKAKHLAEAISKFVRESGRFPLTATGDINTYALFAETTRALIGRRGRAGIIVPTGIATDDTNKEFFADLNGKQGLVSLYDFENREGIFPGVHRAYKFALLTVSGAPIHAADFAFFLTRVEQARDSLRRFQLSADDLALLNPNTRTCPVFRTSIDAKLTQKISRHVPTLLNGTSCNNPSRSKSL